MTNPSKSENLKLKLDDYLQFLFSKHHVIPGSYASTFEEVINSVVGVHSARLSTPYIAFRARINNIVPADYRAATYSSNRLIKLRCMRKTLHTVTQELAPIVHTATLALRTSEIQTHLIRNGFSQKETSDLLKQIIKLLGQPETHSQFLILIKNCIELYRPHLSLSRKNTVARLLLKWLWESGQICYINQAKHWAREIRLYGNIHYLYPNLNLNGISRTSAVRELVSRYIRAFEPVSEKDIAWWTGIRMSEIRIALKSMQEELSLVTLEGVADDLFITIEGINNYLHFNNLKLPSSWCAFLAYEDPTLKGYFNTRGRYVDQTHYNKLFNQIGEVRPSIVINGRVVGIWAWNAKSERISIKLFRALSVEEINLVSIKKCEIENYLDETKQIKMTL
jgi:hypothetical protein